MNNKIKLIIFFFIISFYQSHYMIFRDMLSDYAASVIIVSIISGWVLLGSIIALTWYRNR